MKRDGSGPSRSLTRQLISDLKESMDMKRSDITNHLTQFQ